MCQDFVDFVELSEFCRDEGWSFEPVLVPSLKDKLLLVKVDEIRTLMPTGSHNGNVVSVVGRGGPSPLRRYCWVLRNISK